ncbi:MAG: HAMP domain-containing protein [Cyanobacteria bacterium SBC]|nr:HAMP domain-containing protein [Cyanobacteria bacterium SBC]
MNVPKWKWIQNLQFWEQRLLDRLSVSQKLGYGYALAISIAILGTTVGLLIGNYYERKAEITFDLSDERRHHIEDLQENILRLQLHPVELLSVLENPMWFHYEVSQFQSNISEIQTCLSELEIFVEQNTKLFPDDAIDLKVLLQNCNRYIEAYVQWMEALQSNVAPDRVDAKPYQVAQTEFLKTLTGEEAVQLRVRFERLSEQLTRLDQWSQRNMEQAKIQRDRAVNLRVGAIALSMLLSATIAALLATRTSRAIADPVLSVTKIARQVTEDANFTLQAPVTTRDEIGSLAKSLNQLIQWVEEYTDKLEAARNNLEHRVAERTQELENTLHELKQTQMQLVQNEKMSSLGQMVAGVAHEINNPVNFIYGNLTHADEYTNDLLELLSLYQKYYPNPNFEIQDKIEEVDLDFLKNDLVKLHQSMRVGAERIKEIVKSLRVFSRLDESDLKNVDIHDGIDSTLTILFNRLKAKKHRPEIQVIKQYGQLPPIECYAGQLNQVFMNILSNAIDALEEKFDRSHANGFKDRSQNNELVSLQIQIHTRVIEDNSIEICISDNACGIPEHVKKHLFDPFFTTKPIGKGTGLGLSISHQVITQKHDGKLECISSVGKGTKFIIQIPCQYHDIDRSNKSDLRTVSV